MVKLPRFERMCELLYLPHHLFQTVVHRLLMSAGACVVLGRLQAKLLSDEEGSHGAAGLDCMLACAERKLFGVFSLALC